MLNVLDYFYENKKRIKNVFAIIEDDENNSDGDKKQQDENETEPINDFNKKTDYYHTSFKEYNDIDNANNEKYLKCRNLLYVAITRAKENLRMLYIEPNFDEIKDNFELIFGKAVEWNDTDSIKQ